MRDVKDTARGITRYTDHSRQKSKKLKKCERKKAHRLYCPQTSITTFVRTDVALNACEETPCGCCGAMQHGR